MLPTPAVVEQHTEQDEHQQGQRAQDGEQEQGVVGGDVPQARMRQTQSCKTNHGKKKSLWNFTSTTQGSTTYRRDPPTALPDLWAGSSFCYCLHTKNWQTSQNCQFDGYNHANNSSAFKIWKKLINKQKRLCFSSADTWCLKLPLTLAQLMSFCLWFYSGCFYWEINYTQMSPLLPAKKQTWWLKIKQFLVKVSQNQQKANRRKAPVPFKNCRLQQN